MRADTQSHSVVVLADRESTWLPLGVGALMFVGVPLAFGPPSPLDRFRWLSSSGEVKALVGCLGLVLGIAIGAPALRAWCRQPLVEAAGDRLSVLRAVGRKRILRSDVAEILVVTRGGHDTLEIRSIHSRPTVIGFGFQPSGRTWLEVVLELEAWRGGHGQGESAQSADT